jgi:hypothetical protein
MRRAVILCGTASFIMALLGTVVGFSLVAPSAATAQPTQAQEVQASAFVLVGTDGTVLGRWEPGPGGGANLRLNNADGTQRMTVSAGSQIASYGPDGTTLTFRAGRSTEDYTGPVPVNGLLLGPDGAVGILP